jgi:hypothetical protein
MSLEKKGPRVPGIRKQPFADDFQTDLTGWAFFIIFYDF